MGDIEFNSALITGGAGFIGSHLAEKLVGEGIETKILDNFATGRKDNLLGCLLYTSPSPRDGLLSRMPSSA